MFQVPKEFVVMAGLLTVPAIGFTKGPKEAQDPRQTRLERFFVDHASPLVKHAADFIAAADKNGLDWRLLPSISIVESGGAKDYKDNNIFGWDCGRSKFSSIRAAIHTIAEKLSTSRLYRHKNVDQILKTYNSRPEYSLRVKSLMASIGRPDMPAMAALN